MDSLIQSDSSGSGTHVHLDDVVRAFALALCNQIVYGRMHRVSVESFQDAFERLATYLREHGSLLLGGSKGHLIANSRYIELKTKNLQAMAQAFEEREITGMEFEPGATARELHLIFDVLCASLVEIDGWGGIAAMLEKNGVENIRLAQGQRDWSPEDELPAAPHQTAAVPVYKPGDPEHEAAILLAFLSTETTDKIERASVAVGGLAGDAHVIAETIFQAATSRSGDGFGGCDFDVLVDCIRKVAEAIACCPAAETTGGRLMLMGTLDDLKEELLFSVQTDDADSDFAQHAIERIIEGAKERLSIEKLVAEYANKRRLLDSRERRILEFLRHKGFGATAAELERRLKSQGVSAELWEELWDKSFRRAPEPKAAAASESAVDRFAQFAKAPPPRGGRSGEFLDQLINHMADVELEMVSQIEQTRQRIDRLGETLQKAQRSPGGPRKEDMAELARLLIQVGQGLGDPIKMLEASVEMVRSSNLGRLNEAQHAVLQMVAISGQRLRSLANQVASLVESSRL